MSRYSALRLLDSFFRRWWLYLVPVVLLTALGAATVASKADTYTSTGTFSVATSTLLQRLSNTSSSNSFGYDSPALATTKQLNARLNTESFLKDVVSRAGLTKYVESGELRLSQVKKALVADATEPTLVHVTATFEDPVVAQRLSQATVDSFTQLVVDANVSESESATAFYNELLQTYNSDVTKARAALDQFLADNPSPGFGATRSDSELIRIQALQADVTNAQERYNAAVTKAEDARLQTEQVKNDVGNLLRLVDAPKLPEAPQGKMKKAAVTLALFMVLGALLAATGVVLATTLDRSIRFASDLRSTLGVRVLAVVPEVKELRSKARRRDKRVAEPALERAPLVAGRVARTGAPTTRRNRRPVGAEAGTLDARPAERRAPDHTEPPRPPAPRPDRVPAAPQARPVARPDRPATRPVDRPPTRPAVRPDRAPARTTAGEPEPTGGPAWSPARRDAAEPRAEGGTGPAPTWPPKRKPGDIPRAG